MISFESDYTTGAHPKVLERLAATNAEPQPGYGADEYCERARASIRAACGRPDAQVEFICGGTQTNAVVISTMLADHEGVIAARTGHIACHEAGAIEYAGHKVIELEGHGGKLRAADVEAYAAAFESDVNREHEVAPGMVYVSHPTEYGTIYTKAELTALSETCRAHGMRLFLDGARLGYGLYAVGADLTLTDVARLCAVFYIGGTKVGALCGEAVVFTHGNRPPHFLNAVKRRGALLAKGRLLGVQFDALFTDGLYGAISRHAVAMAARIRDAFTSRGFATYVDSPTNQQFIVLPDAQAAALAGRVRWGFWEKPEPGVTVIRLAACWSTTDADIAELEAALDDLAAAGV